MLNEPITHDLVKPKASDVEQRKAIDIQDVTAEQLDALARSLQPNAESKDFEQLRGVARVMAQQLISLPDYDEGLTYAGYQLAWGLCNIAYQNGKNAAEKASQGAAELSVKQRDSIGDEIGELEVERATYRLNGYLARAEFFRAVFAGFRDAYRAFVKSADLPSYCEADWVPWEKTKVAQRKAAEDRRKSFAQAQAEDAKRREEQARKRSAAARKAAATRRAKPKS